MAAIDGKYLSKEGLTYLWSKLKAILSGKLEPSDVFGLGASIPNDSDLDEYTTIGVFYRNSTSHSSVHSVPLDGYAFKLKVEYVNSSSRLRQTFIPLSASADSYVRIRNSSGWQPWRVFKSIEGILECGPNLVSSALNPLDIHSVTTCGRYAILSSDTEYMTNLPISGTGGELIVEQSQGSTRIRQTFYPTGAPEVFYVSLLYAGKPGGTGSDAPVWSPWRKYDSDLDDWVVWNINTGTKNVLRVDSVGGSASNAARTYLTQGVRFTVNRDGTITVNREEAKSSNAIVYLYYRGSAYHADEYCNTGFRFTSGVETSASTVYFSFARLSSGSTQRMTENQIIPDKGSYSDIWISVTVNSSYSPSNLVLKPMIRPAIDTDTTFVGYTPTNRELNDNFGAIGTQLLSGDDVFQLAPGRYWTDSSAVLGSLLNMPTDYSFPTAVLDVVEATRGAGTTNIRRRITLYSLTASAFYVASETSSGYGSWYKFQGAVVS